MEHLYDPPKLTLGNLTFFFWPSTLFLYTACLLIFASVFTGLSVFQSNLQCMEPLEYANWKEYVLSYCYINSTYDLGINDILFESKATISTRKVYVNHYRWNPYYFFGLCAMCYFISELCQFLIKKLAGFNFVEFLATCTSAHLINEKPEENTKHFDEVVYELLKFLNEKGKGTHFVIGYLITQLIPLFTYAFLLHVITSFANEGSYLWGIYALFNWFIAGYWEQLKAFPYITFCDFSRAVLANEHEVTVQCALQFNMLNDKIYVILWCWLVFAFIEAFISTLYTAALLFLASWRYSEVRGFLQLDEDNERQEDESKAFTDKLKSHGLLILLLIKDHRDFYVTCKIADFLKNKMMVKEIPNQVTGGQALGSQQPTQVTTGGQALESEKENGHVNKKNPVFIA